VKKKNKAKNRERKKTSTRPNNFVSTLNELDGGKGKIKSRRRRLVNIFEIFVSKNGKKRGTGRKGQRSAFGVQKGSRITRRTQKKKKGGANLRVKSETEKRGGGEREKKID